MEVQSIKRDRFHFTLGTHLPALNFITTEITVNGIDQEIIKARRFFPVVELFPNYFISNNISTGFFYQYGHSLEKDLAKHTHFAVLRASFTNIRISEKYYMNFGPQFYYLKMDNLDGFYAVSGLTISRDDFPFSISSLMNNSFKTSIPGKRLDWNISVVYSIDKIFVPQ